MQYLLCILIILIVSEEYKQICNLWAMLLNNWVVNLFLTLLNYSLNIILTSELDRGQLYHSQSLINSLNWLISYH
jgi:hypothetical protein